MCIAPHIALNFMVCGAPSMFPCSKIPMHNGSDIATNKSSVIKTNPLDLDVIVSNFSFHSRKGVVFRLTGDKNY